MNRDSEVLARATAMLVKEQVEGVADAAATLIGETRKELTKEIAARTAGAATAAAAVVRPAIAAAEARKAALLRRRADTLATVQHWLRECADDEA